MLCLTFVNRLKDSQLEERRLFFFFLKKIWIFPYDLESIFVLYN